MRILLALFILALFSCNPVKKVLKDPKKFDRIKDSVIARGYCANDTVYFDSIEIDTVHEVVVLPRIIEKVPCDDFDSGSVVVKDGKMKIKDTCVDRVITQTKTNVVVDRKREESLTKRNAALEKENEVLKKEAKGKFWDRLKWAIIGIVLGVFIVPVSRLVTKIVPWK